LAQWHRQKRKSTPSIRVRWTCADGSAVLPAPTFTDVAEDIPLAIVYEDADLLVIDKPAGLVVHPGNGNAHGTLMNALLHHAPELAAVPRAGIVHRLDKDTSGLLVVAKTLASQTDLVRQLQARTVKRHYLALVHGKVGAGGTVDAPMGRHPVQRTKMAIVKQGGKEARTHYAVLERFSRCTLIECRLDTGRTHQIRVHLQHEGHPIVGDDKYGDFALNKALGRAEGACPGVDRGQLPQGRFERMFLHARYLRLAHPVTGQDLTLQAPLPPECEQLLSALAP
jgi:23S rRNA pseudouridine1911/1915/1917 synthase